MVLSRVDWEQVKFHEKNLSERSYDKRLVKSALRSDLEYNDSRGYLSEDCGEWSKLWRSPGIDTVTILGLALLTYGETGILWSPYGIKTIPQAWIAWYRATEYKAPYENLLQEHPIYLNNTRRLRRMTARQIDASGYLGWHLNSREWLKDHARRIYVHDATSDRGYRADWAKKGFA